MAPFSLNKKLDSNDPMPRYYQLYVSLRSRMEAGEFVPKDLLPTEKELGEEYGVSRITVIKALDMLELEGYIERQQGRGTFVVEKAENNTNGNLQPQTVAFVCHALSHPYLAGILVGVAAALAKSGFSLQVFGSVDSSKSEAQSVQQALDREINGLILLPWSDFQNQALYRDLIGRGLPLVMVDRYYPDIKTDHVIFDDWQAGYDITSRLIERGHQKIAFTIADEILPTSVHERLSGYKAALENHGLAYDENLVWADMSSKTMNMKDRPSSSRVESKLINNLCTEQPTGVISVNYDVAEFVLYTLHSLALQNQSQEEFLKQIEIGAVCHKPSPAYAPYVSVLAMQSGELLGNTAAEVLVGRINRTLPEIPKQIKLPMAVVEIKPARN